MKLISYLSPLLTISSNCSSSSTNLIPWPEKRSFAGYNICVVSLRSDSFMSAERNVSRTCSTLRK